MADSSINLNVYKRQITYLKELMSKLDTIVPEKKRQPFHIPITCKETVNKIPNVKKKLIFE